MRLLLLMIVLAAPAEAKWPRTSAGDPVDPQVLLAGQASDDWTMRKRANGALRTVEGRSKAIAHLIRGLASYRLGRYREALKDFRATEKSRLRIRDFVTFLKAESHFHAGDYRSAERIYRQFEAKFPMSVWRHRAVLRIGDCLLAQERWGPGIRHLTRALDTFPEYPHRVSAWFALAEAERARGKPARAALWYARLVRGHVKDPLALVAKRALEGLAAQGVVAKKESPEEAFRYAYELRRRKYLPEAITALTALAEDAATPSKFVRKARFQIGRAQFQLERFAEADATWQALADKAPNLRTKRLCWRWQSKARARLGKLDEAAKLRLKGEGSVDKPDAETMERVAWLYFDGGAYKKARDWFHKVSKRSSAWASRTRWLRIWLTYRLGKLKRALKGFKALERGSKRWKHRWGYWVARTLLKMGEKDAAIDTWRGVIRYSPLSYYAYSARARLRELGVPVDPDPPTDPEAEDPAAEEPTLHPDERPSSAKAAAKPAGTPDAAAPVAADAGVGSAEAGTPDAGALAEASVSTPDAAVPAPPGPEPTPEELAAIEKPVPKASRDPLLAVRYLAHEWGGAFPRLIAAYEYALIGEPIMAFQQLRYLSDERGAFLRAGAPGRWGYAPRPYIDYREGKAKAEWGRLYKDKVMISERRRRDMLRRLPKDMHIFLRRAFSALGDEHYARRHAFSRKRSLVGAPEDPENNTAWRRHYPKAFKALVEREAGRYELVDPYLIWALMRVESTYNPWAISRASARGLMQVMPHTGGLIADRMGARNFGHVLLFEPQVAIAHAAWYFNQLLTKFNGQLPLAVASYNAGPHRMAAWLSVKGKLPMDEFIEEIPFTEAREYAKKVQRYFALYRRVYEGSDGLRTALEIDPEFGDNINF